MNDITKTTGCRQKMNKTKIINVLQHPPAYENYRNSPRPEINWNTPDGNWVGIWGTDWPDLLGNEIRKLTDEFEYEVWQPDLRADKIYAHRFDSGLKHKLFPAKTMQNYYGLKKYQQVTSPTIMQAIKNVGTAIIHLNSVNSYLSSAIIKEIKLPLLIQFHSKSFHPSWERTKLRKNIVKNYYYFILSHTLSKRQCYYVYCNSHTTKSLKKTNRKRLFMGVDFDKFLKQDLIDSKESLSLPPNKPILLIASRFTPGKQIDKVIKIAIKLSKQHDFHLVIAGHGDREYEEYLRALAKPLAAQNKASFPGYLSGTTLTEAYSASNLFISASVAEGGPVSVMKAFACETPVMCTRVGGVDDIMAENDAGILVEPFDYEQWERELQQFFKGKPVKPLDRNIAKKYFHWPNIANEFIKVYRHLCNA